MITVLGKVFMLVNVTKNVTNHTPTVILSGAKLEPVVPEFAPIVAEIVYPSCVIAGGISVLYP